MTEAGVFDLSDLEGTRAGVRAFAEAIAARIPDKPSVSQESGRVRVAHPPGLMRTRRHRVPQVRGADRGRPPGGRPRQ
jgi:hypothetical protein